MLDSARLIVYIDTPHPMLISVDMPPPLPDRIVLHVSHGEKCSKLDSLDIEAVTFLQNHV